MTRATDMPWAALPPLELERDGACSPRNRDRYETRLLAPRTGAAGGTRRTKSGRWAAQIQVNGKRRHVGTFDTREEAAAAYADAVAGRPFPNGEVDFYPERGTGASAAKAKCAVCPVKEMCLEWALLNCEHGIWGGTSERERRRLRLQRGWSQQRLAQLRQERAA